MTCRIAGLPDTLFEVSFNIGGRLILPLQVHADAVLGHGIHDGRG